MNTLDKLNVEVAVLRQQLARANRIIGWMEPYIGSMCPPDNGLAELNDHHMENYIPAPGEETKGRPIGQKTEHTLLVR